MTCDYGAGYLVAWIGFPYFDVSASSNLTTYGEVCVSTDLGLTWSVITPIDFPYSSTGGVFNRINRIRYVNGIFFLLGAEMYSTPANNKAVLYYSNNVLQSGGSGSPTQIIWKKSALNPVASDVTLAGLEFTDITAASSYFVASTKGIFSCQDLITGTVLTHHFNVERPLVCGLMVYPSGIIAFTASDTVRVYDKSGGTPSWQTVTITGATGYVFSAGAYTSTNTSKQVFIAGANSASPYDVKVFSVAYVPGSALSTAFTEETLQSLSLAPSTPYNFLDNYKFIYPVWVDVRECMGELFVFRALPADLPNSGTNYDICYFSNFQGATNWKSITTATRSAGMGRNTCSIVVPVPLQQSAAVRYTVDIAAVLPTSTGLGSFITLRNNSGRTIQPEFKNGATSINVMRGRTTGLLDVGLQL